MFPDEQETYPGRKFVQILQVILVIAIGVFGVMALARPSKPSTPIPTTAPIIVPTAAPDNTIETLYDQAYEAHHEDNYELAIDLYTQVLELDTSLPNVWLGRAVAYEQLGGTQTTSRRDFWRYLQLMQTERIERDITANKSLSLEMAEGRVYALSFEAKSGDTLDITANGVEPEDDAAEVDPLLVLLLDDTPVQSDDDTLRSDGSLINMNSHIDGYKVTSNGTYIILLSHAGGGSEGLIDVTVTAR